MGLPDETCNAYVAEASDSCDAEAMCMNCMVQVRAKDAVVVERVSEGEPKGSLGGKGASDLSIACVLGVRRVCEELEVFSGYVRGNFNGKTGIECVSKATSLTPSKLLADAKIGGKRKRG